MSSGIPSDIRSENKRGGRQSLHKILVTADQYAWLSKQLARREHLGEVTGVNKKNPKLFKIIAELGYRLTQAVPITDGAVIESLHLETTRQELRVLGDIVERQATALRDKILPAYAKKKSIEGAASYGTRMLEASALLLSLDALSEQIERVYDQGSHRRNSQYGKR